MNEDRPGDTPGDTTGIKAGDAGDEGDMSCDNFKELAPAFALEVLEGRERPACATSPAPRTTAAPRPSPTRRPSPPAWSPSSPPLLRRRTPGGSSCSLWPSWNE